MIVEPVDALVLTRSCYVGVFDLGSPVNERNFWKREFRKISKLRPKYWFSPTKRELRLLEFNGLLIDRMTARQLACWTLLFDGAFRARLSVGAGAAAPPGGSVTGQNLGGQDFRATIDCPTGRVVVACLSRAGEPSLHPQLVIPPGRYEAHVARDTAAEGRHEFIESEGGYPSGEGPDWHVTLRPA